MNNDELKDLLQQITNAMRQNDRVLIERLEEVIPKLLANHSRYVNVETFLNLILASWAGQLSF